MTGESLRLDIAGARPAWRSVVGSLVSRAFDRLVPRASGPRAARISPGGLVGSAIVAVLLLAALLAPLLAPYPPDALAPADRLAPPGWAHPLGADALGRDLLSRLLYGARIAVQMAGLAVGLSAAVGMALGSLAGYHGGRLDQALARVMDAWLSLPAVLVALVVVARLGPSLNNLILALGVMGVPAYFRLVRAMTLSARRAPYVEAAQAVGAGDARIMARHILPNIAAPIIVQTTLRLGVVLLTGGSLSFIGLGAQPPTPEWGALLAAGRGAMDTAWWLAVFPGLAITITVLGFNLLGDGLRDALNPHQRR